MEAYIVDETGKEEFEPETPGFQSMFRVCSVLIRGVVLTGYPTRNCEKWQS